MLATWYRLLRADHTLRPIGDQQKKSVTSAFFVPGVARHASRGNVSSTSGVPNNRPAFFGEAVISGRGSHDPQAGIGSRDLLRVRRGVRRGRGSLQRVVRGDLERGNPPDRVSGHGPFLAADRSRSRRRRGLLGGRQHGHGGRHPGRNELALYGGRHQEAPQQSPQDQPQTLLCEGDAGQGLPRAPRPRGR